MSLASHEEETKNATMWAPRGKSVRHRVLIAGAAVVALVLTGATTAIASTDADPNAAAEAVAAVAPSDLQALPSSQSDDQLMARFEDGGSVTTGMDPSDGIAFAAVDEEHVTTVSVPGAAALSDGSVSDDGSVTFAGDSSVPSVNVLAAADAVRISTVITSERQTESFAYDFGSDATVEIQEDGSALVLKDAEPDETVPEGASAIELIVADIAAPWAADATGAPVKTYYLASGGVLTQVVEHRAAAVEYPVVADPTFDSPNVIQVRVRFNRAETATIAAGGWGGFIASFKCGVMMPICVLATTVVAYQAGVAQNSKPKRCVQITATSPIVIPGLVWWVDTYSGGSCR